MCDSQTTLPQRLGYVFKRLPLLMLAGVGYISIVGSALHRLTNLTPPQEISILIGGALALGLYSRRVNPPPWKNNHEDGE